MKIRFAARTTAAFAIGVALSGCVSSIPEVPETGADAAVFADVPPKPAPEPEKKLEPKEKPEPAEKDEAAQNPAPDGPENSPVPSPDAPIPVTATGFECTEANGTVSLHHRGNTVVLRPNTLRAEFNGGVIHLLHKPTRDSDGPLLLHRQDVEKVITPLLTGKTGISRKRKTILIDPGHGGQELGALGERHQEKKLNLILGRKVAEELVRRGFKVKMTRPADIDLSLDERAAMTGELQADLFLSIHHNASTARQATGVETYALTPAGAISTNGRGIVSEDPLPGNRFDAANLILAREIQSRLYTATGGPDRGVRFARFRVLAKAQCPAILIEAGFISNPQEEEVIAGEERQAKVVKAVADGVVEFNRLCGE